MIAFPVAASVLLIAAFVPIVATLRARATVVPRREAALARHRAQLVALERDRATGLIPAEDHAGARLEIERRLLAADALRDADAPPRSAPLIAAFVLLPVATIALYLVDGHPMMASQPLAPRLAARDATVMRTRATIAELQAGLARAAPGTDHMRQGLVVLGELDASIADWRQAAIAWRGALAIAFDPMLAAETAEAGVRAAGRVDAEDAALFARALAAAPADAPWRSEAEARIAQSERH